MWWKAIISAKVDSFDVLVLILGDRRSTAIDRSVSIEEKWLSSYGVEVDEDQEVQIIRGWVT